MTGPIAVVVAALLTGAPLSPSEEAHAAETAAAEGRWDDASAAFGRAYDASGDPRYLYARAQVERLGGDCKAALPLYEAFVQTEPDAASLDAANGFLALCREEVGPPEPEPVEPIALADPEPVPTVVEPSPAPVRPWYRDPWGGALVGTGAVAVAVCGVLVGVGFRTADAAEQAPDDRAFGDEIDRARRLTIAGVATAGVGGALLTAGIVRWALQAKKNDAVSLGLSPQGIVLRGRF